MACGGVNKAALLVDFVGVSVLAAYLVAGSLLATVGELESADRGDFVYCDSGPVFVFENSGTA